MERPPEIPTIQKYVEEGGRPENYAGDLKKLQEQHEAYILDQAKAKAKRTMRVRVTAKGWPGKQTHYRVPSKAPYDPRLRPGEEGFEAGAEAGAEAAADGVQAFSDEDAWDVLEEIPNDSAAALVLIEHHWAVPLRDAVMRAGGFRIADGFISPLDLVEIGLVSAAEAEQLHAQVTAGAASTN